MHNRRSIAAFDSLEPRRLFSAAASVTLGDDGLLTVVGTERRDVVLVSLVRNDPSTLTVRANGRSSTYPVSEVSRVRVDTLGGNDSVLVSERFGAVRIPFEVHGGAGNDAVTTGSGNDLVLVGAGRDTVSTGAGDDQIDGGSGDDVVTGGADDDRIFGDLGRDRIDAGAGDDDIDAGLGNDRVTTGSGNDTVDTSTLGEVRGPRTTVASYTVSQDTDLKEQFTALCEQIVVGAIVRRVQVSGTTITALYTYGNDPELYRVVVSTQSGEFDLVSREISPSEFRASAVAAFTVNNPNLGIRSILQRPASVYDIRYIAPGGATVLKASNAYVFTTDDLDQDLDNNGIRDSMGEGDAAEL